MKILEVKGNYYQMGLEIGNYFKDYYKSIIIPYLEAIKKEEVLTALNEIKSKLESNFKNALDELNGRADGAKIDRDVMLLMASPELFKKTSGCTSVAYSDGSNIYLSHNEDESDFNVENQILIKYVFDDHFVYGYTNAFKLIGSAFGFNSYGLVFVSNWLPFDHIEENEISRFIYEYAVMNAKSVKEATNIIENMSIATPFSMSIIDLNARKMTNFEKDFEKTYITEVNGVYAHSNHFLNKNFEASESSKFRANYPINTLAGKEKVTLTDLQDVLNQHCLDYDHSVFKKHDYADKPITVANISVNSVNRVVTIKGYLDDSLLNFAL